MVGHTGTPVTKHWMERDNIKLTIKSKSVDAIQRFSPKL